MVKLTGKEVAGVIGMTLGVIVGVAIGGAFTTGAFLNVPLLKYLPLLLHEIVGWTLIVGSVFSGLLGLFSKK